MSDLKGQLPTHRYWLLWAILLSTATVYFRGLFGSYTFDDFPNIVDNVELHVSTLVWSDWWAAMFSSPASDLQRPLAMLSFAINYFLTGLDPIPIKATNLAVHLLNVVLAYALARRLFHLGAQRATSPPTAARIEGAALALAALWALAPINLAPVLLAVQRMESLANLFVFAGLCLYIDGRVAQLDGRSGWGRILLGIGACTAVGVLAKETAAMIPLYAFIVEWLFFGFATRARTPDRRLFVLFALVLLLPLVLGLAWLLPHALAPGAYSGRSFTLTERLLTETRILWDYVRWTLVPNLGTLSLYHDDYVVSHSLLAPITTLFAICGLLAAFIVAIVVRSAVPMVALGVLWYFAAHALTATVIPLELIYEHRNYFASFALLLIVVHGLVLTTAAQRLAFAGMLAIAALAVFYGLTTFLRASEWGNPIRFALSEVAKHPLSPRATYDEGRTYVILSDYDVNSTFLPLARKSLIAAAAVPNSTMLPEQALLMVAARTGTEQDPAWWAAMQTKLNSHPVGVQEISALYSLSRCQEEGHCSFDTGNMLDTFYAAIGTHPKPDVLTIFGNYALNVMHDYDLALRLLRGAIELKPRDMQYHENLAKVLIFLRRFDEAGEEIQTMRGLDRLGVAGSRIAALQTRLENAQKQPDASP